MIRATGIAAVVFVLSVGLAPAATFYVNSTAETVDVNPGDGVCADGSAQCSLRAAVMEANALAGADAVHVTSTWYTFTGADLPITSDISFLGPADITKNSSSRLFDIQAGATVVIDNLTLRGETNAGDGGLIRNAGTLTVRNSTIRDMFLYAGPSAPMSVVRGGAIYNSGTLTVERSTFRSVRAFCDKGAAGPCDAYGGSIWNSGTATIRATVFMMSGGVSASTQSTGSNGAGGAIYSTGTLTVTEGSFSSQFATDDGGSNGAEGGAIWVGGTANVTSVTFWSNSASKGGAVFRAAAAQLTVSGVTFVDNGAHTGGSLYHADPTGTNGFLKLHNSILTNNRGVTMTGRNCYATTPITSLGYNLVQNNDSCSIATSSGDQIGTPGAPIDAKLVAFNDDQHFKPAADSPAFETGDPLNPPATDMDGIRRPQDSDHDGVRRAEIGAMEVCCSKLRVSDFDGDFKSDIFWHHTTSGQTYLWRMTGATAATALSVYGIGDTNWKPVAVNDFNADGKADVFFRHATTGANYLWLMDGATITAALPATPLADTNWQIAGSGDFDGNGRADLLWRHATSGAVYVWIMNGPDLVTSAPLPELGSDWRFAGTGDVGGDGRADIVWNRLSDKAIFVWNMDGPTLRLTVGWRGVTGDVLAVADFDNDQKSDVVYRLASGEIRGSSAVPQYWTGQDLSGRLFGNVADTNWKVVAYGDFDDDGDLDLFWRHDVHATNYYWDLQTGGTVQAPGPAVTDAAWKAMGPR